MWKRYLLPGVFFVGLAVFVGYPTLVVLIGSLTVGAGIGPDVYFRLFTERSLAGILWSSLGVASLASLAATTLGLCISVVVFKTDLPLRRLFGAAAVLPMIIPGFVATLAFLYLFGRNGLISYQWLGLDLDIYSWKSVLFVQAVDFTTISFLLISAVLVTVDSHVEDAARNLGANEWSIFATVTFPLVRPGIIASLLLVFMRSMGDFATPLLLGGRFNTLASASYIQLIGSYNMPVAAALNVLLLVLCLVTFWFYLRAQRAQSRVRLRAGGEHAPLKLPGPIRQTLWAVSLLFTIYILSVLASVFLAAITKHLGANYAVTLDYFRTLPSRSFSSILNTLVFAFATAAAMSLIGVIAAYVVTRIEFRGRSVLEFLITVPFAVPGTFMGVGYVLAFNQVPLLLTGTWVIVFVLVLVRELPLGLRSGVSVLEQQDRAIEDASVNLGASRLTTFCRVILPLARPVLLVSSLYAFVATVQTVGAIIFVITPGTKLLSVDVFEAIFKGDIGAAAALSVTMLLLSAAGGGAIYLTIQRETAAKWVRKMLGHPQSV
jgi:iron(III) transport system permease protein